MQCTCCSLIALYYKAQCYTTVYDDDVSWRAKSIFAQNQKVKSVDLCLGDNCKKYIKYNFVCLLLVSVNRLA